MNLADLRHPGALVGPMWAVATGRGPALVLLHGNSESHHVFDRLVPLLAPHVTLVGLDSRGHGLSPRGLGVLRISRMADDVAQVLTELDLLDAPILGFSDGGNIALDLAVRHRDVTGPLIVIGANLFPDGLMPLSKLVTQAAHAASEVGAQLLPGLAPLAERLDLMVSDPQIDPAALHDVRQPVLVVAGEHDVIRPEHTHLIAAALPNAELLTIPGAGHMIPRDEAPRLAVAVEQFLRAWQAGLRPRTADGTGTE